MFQANKGHSCPSSPEISAPSRASTQLELYTTCILKAVYRLQPISRKLCTGCVQLPATHLPPGATGHSGFSAPLALWTVPTHMLPTGYFAGAQHPTSLRVLLATPFPCQEALEKKREGCEERGWYTDFYYQGSRCKVNGCDIYPCHR